MKIAANKELKFTPPLGVSGAAPLAPESVKEYEVERGSIVGDAYGQSEANCVITVNYSYLISKSLPGGMRTFRLLRPILTRVISPLLKPLPPGTGKLIGLSVSMLLPLLKPFVKRGARGKPSKAVKAGSCGIPIPDTDVKLIDTETGEEAPVGEPGELYYRGPQLMLGYWPTPGKGLTEDGYLPSGDIAVMDEDGFFKIVDRTKDMINVSGFKVYTELLDEALRKHPAVYAAGAIGIPDPDIGRVVKK
jgi:acyl-CoA synthetase (AMP-forming)/AMP-acid ligase II